MIAGKMYDMVMGVDIHIVNIPSPGGPIPTPLPHPFIGMLFDPMEYAPIIGSTVWINNQPGAYAGMAGKAMPPHIPMGAGFTKGVVGNECEQFMGSATVLLQDEPLSRMGDMTLSCSCIGMPPPPRKKSKGGVPGLMMPTSQLIAIPAGQMVMVGGPPTISMMGMGIAAGMKGLKGLGKGLNKLRKKSKLLKKAANKLGDAAKKAAAKTRNAVNKLKCTITGHPVDVATGKVFTDIIDFHLPGPIPIEWERTWFSTSDHKGPLGHGWHHPYDMFLKFDGEAEAIQVRLNDGRDLFFDHIEEHELAYNKQERMTLRLSGKLYAMTDASGLSYFFSKPRSGDLQQQGLLKIANRNGDQLNFSYTNAGALKAITDSTGRQIKIVTNNQGRIKEIRLPHPSRKNESFPIVSYTYDRAGNLKESKDAMGHSFFYEYEQHLLIKETNRNGLSFQFTYDGNGVDARCIRTWGDEGIYDHKLKYDLELGLTTMTNSLGHQSKHYWNEDGLVLQTVDSLGDISRKEYDEALQLIKETDELGNETNFSYDQEGNQIEVVFPDDTKVELEYKNNLLTGAIDQLGNQWNWKYNEKGQLIKRTDPLAGTQSYAYENGLLSKVINAIGGETTLLYYEHKNLVELIMPDGEKNKWKYDYLGRTIEAIDVNQNSRKMKYQFNGLIRQVNEPDGNVRKMEFDPEENVTRVTDNQRDVKFEYAGFNTLKARVEAGTRVEFKYDTEEDLLGIINDHGYAYRFERDAKGQVITESGFDELRRKYKRDKLGRVTKVIRPGKRFSDYAYDSMGQILAVEHHDGRKEEFGYRDDGQLITATNEHVNVSFKRDALGRVVEEQQGVFTIESSYNGLGQRVRLSSSMGADIDITRNVMGDVESVTSSGEAGNWEAQFKRDNFGLETERLLPGGVRSTWKRDKLGRPIAQSTFAGGGEKTRDRQYKWDVNYRLKQIKDEAKGTWIFNHDVFGNLSSATYPDGSEELKMPDTVGNLFRSKKQKDRVYGPAGQLLEAEGTRFTYDAEGNLIQKKKANGETWEYVWNSSGMLSIVLRPDGHKVEFSYDALGRRISKRFKSKVTHWVWDGNFMLHEWVDKTGNRKSRQTERLASVDLYKQLSNKDLYRLAQSANGPPADDYKIDANITTWIFEPESFAPLAKLTADSSIAVVTDHLGTPVQLFNEEGEKNWESDLSIYGEVRNLDGDREACPFRYPGQYEDVETGLYYNRFRYYDAEYGIYVSQDPIKFQGQNPNFYAYTFDSNNQIDPFGLSCGHAAKAKELGYVKTKFRSHGQAVYTKKKASGDVKFITPDVDSHVGGYWKGADSVKNLGSKRTRSGTYDADLKRIAD